MPGVHSGRTPKNEYTLCGAVSDVVKDTGYYYTCKKKKGHILHPTSRSQRQHCDMKTSPAYYWDPKEEELNEAHNVADSHSG